MTRTHMLWLFAALFAPNLGHARKTVFDVQCALRTPIQFGANGAVIDSTGDNMQDAFGWASNANARAREVNRPFGINPNAWDRQFDFTPCPTDTFSNVTCAGRRILNALTLMDQVTHLDRGYTWMRWAAARTDTLSPEMDCGGPWGVHSTSWNGQLSSDWRHHAITLSRVPLFYFTVPDRAALMAHEARHHDRRHNASGCESTVTSCDSHFGFNGANTYQVKFYEDLLDSRFQLNPLMRVEAREGANFFLNGWFRDHPGFNLAEEEGVTPGWGDTIAIGWHIDTGGQIDTAYFPDPDGPLDAITAIGLTQDGGRITRMRVCYRSINRLGAGARMGNQRCSEFGSQRWQGALERFVQVPANRVVSGVRILSDGDDIQRICLSTRDLVDGVPMANRGTRCSGAPTGDPWDVVLDIPEGFFMTGVGFGANGNEVDAHVARRALSPDFERYRGGMGGTSSLLQCPAGTVAVGMMANDVFVPAFNNNVVGYMGLICMPDEWMTANSPADYDFWSAVVAHSSFFQASDGRYFPSGVDPFMERTPTGVRFDHPSDVRIRYCPLKTELVGVVTRSAAAIDQIVEFRCSNGQFIPFEVGGNGGHVGTEDCWFAPGPSTGNSTLNLRGILVRSGHWLDGMAVQCDG